MVDGIMLGVGWGRNGLMLGKNMWDLADEKRIRGWHSGLVRLLTQRLTDSKSLATFTPGDTRTPTRVRSPVAMPNNHQNTT